MVQPKYSPEEALQRIKLMMEYDSSKTLTENKKVISEQPSVNTVGLTALGAGAGAAIAGAAFGTAIPIPVVGTAVGALVGLGLGILTTWATNEDRGKDGFAELMEVCKAPAASKLVKKMTSSEIRSIAFSIEEAKGEWNDDEDAIVSALQKIETIADLCAVDKKVQGGLVEFLNGITDDPKEWKMFTRPIQGMIEDSEILLTPEEQKKTDAGGKTGKGGGGTKQQTPKIPEYLVNIEGVKKFQDWLDKNKAGWATGFPGGKLNQAGGYGRFGPRTTKAWSSYGQEYQKGGSPQNVETKLTTDVETQSFGGDQTSSAISSSSDQDSNTKTGIS